MSKNALASKPATASFFDPGQVYDFLNTQGVLPAWVQTDPLGDSNATYTRDANTIVSRSPSVSVRAKSSMAHEMTHASQALIEQAASALREKQWEKQPLDPVEQQFLQVYLKTMGNLPGRVGQVGRGGDDRGNALLGLKESVNRLLANSDMSKGYRQYRTTPNELQAWGVGQSIEGGVSSSEQPSHLNPTFATEFSILMDMYNRLPPTTKQLAASTMRKGVQGRLGQVDEAKYAEPLTSYPNPFTK